MFTWKTVAGATRALSEGENIWYFKDEASLLEQKMKDADGVIFATPVYGFQVSYLMKLFIDRHGYIFHRPRFFRAKSITSHHCRNSRNQRCPEVPGSGCPHLGF